MNPADSQGSHARPLRRSKRIRYRLEHFVLNCAVWIVPRLPLWLVHAVADLLGSVAWCADRRGRRSGMENLRLAFGDRFTLNDRRRILRKSYRVFARTFFDLFWSPRIRRENWDRHFILQCDTPAARAAIDEDHCIYVTAHTGGFEWLGIAKALRGRGSMTIAQNFKNPPLTAIFQRLRSVNGSHPVIPQDGALLRILKHLHKGGSAAALVDLTAKPEQGGTVIRTFGMLTSVSHFYCALAQRTGVPLVPSIAEPAPDGRWTARFMDPIYIARDEDLNAAAQRCWNVFEPIIAARPEQWMWMYKHWRYLPEGVSPDKYPAYARRHEGFDAMLRESRKI